MLEMEEMDKKRFGKIQDNIKVEDFLGIDKRQTIEHFISRDATKLQVFKQLFPMAHQNLLIKRYMNSQVLRRGDDSDSPRVGEPLIDQIIDPERLDAMSKSESVYDMPSSVILSQKL